MVLLLLLFELYIKKLCHEKKNNKVSYESRLGKSLCCQLYLSALNNSITHREK